jgi:hypothetical protein
MKVPTLTTPRTRVPSGTLEYQNISAPQGLGDFARTLGNIGAVISARDTKTKNFTALRDFSDFETSVAEQLTEMKRAAPQDGRGFAASADDVYNKQVNEFIKTKIPPELREEFSYRAAELRQKIVVDALDFQYKAGDNFFRQGIATEYDKARSALDPRVGGNPAALDEYWERMQETIDNSDLSEIEQEELKLKIRQGLEGVTYRAEVAKGAATDTMVNLPIAVGTIIEEEAVKANVDPKALKVIAWIESKGNPNAKNPNSSAEGLFQQVDANAASYGVKNRRDPRQSAAGAASFMADNANVLRRVLGREPTVGELYLAHQQGPEGARKLLANPNALAVDIVGYDEVRLNGGAPGMTAQAFADIWINKANKLAGEDIDLDQRFATLPYEDRIALREDAFTEATQQRTQQKKQEDAIYAQNLNTLLTGIHDGTAGQMDIDRFRRNHPNMPFSDLREADNAYKTYQETTGLAAATMVKLESGGIFDPTDERDKKGLNAVIGKPGLQSIGARDQAYVNNGLVPMVSQAQDIPTDVVGLLTGMLRSNNPQNATFALDTLSQLRNASPRGFQHRVTDEVEADLDYWQARKDIVPEDELMKQLNPGITQEERQQRLVLRKEAEDYLGQKVKGVPNIQTLVSDVVGRLDNRIVGTAALPTVPWAAQGLQREFQTLFIDEYERWGDAKKATEQATKILQRSWGETSIGQPVLMKLPPERAGYKQYNGGFDWITDSIRTEQKLRDTEQIQLISDDKTEQEMAAFRADPSAHPPSYRIVSIDEQGNYKVLPGRQWFKPTEEVVQKDIRQFDRDQRMSLITERLLEIDKLAAQANGLQQKLPEEEQEEFFRLMDEYDQLDQENRAAGAPIVKEGPATTAQRKYLQETHDSVMKLLGETFEKFPSRKEFQERNRELGIRRQYERPRF